ncbi:hypothetical protein [Chengkuizengella sediminis]|uniref:hypothetical protein n=1 Tax=Chengkuizengella sediminis TaxID=1885917 RepID=UPI00138A2D8D|nr:hypothetical protein [Chengkuizengella sediminis]NDI35373.1 hypothetical protein [Chengkuizengella sediminis]
MKLLFKVFLLNLMTGPLWFLSGYLFFEYALDQKYSLFHFITVFILPQVNYTLSIIRKRKERYRNNSTKILVIYIILLILFAILMNVMFFTTQGGNYSFVLLSLFLYMMGVVINGTIGEKFKS